MDMEIGKKIASEIAFKKAVRFEAFKLIDRDARQSREWMDRMLDGVSGLRPVADAKKLKLMQDLAEDVSESVHKEVVDKRLVWSAVVEALDGHLTMPARSGRDWIDAVSKLSSIASCCMMFKK